MATKTIYTSTITLPAYVSWKCECCGETNFSMASIVCQREASTASFRPSKNEKAREEAYDLAQADWKEEAYRIIADPNHNAELLRANCHVRNSQCIRCHKKAKWCKKFNMIYTIIPLAGACISLLLVLSQIKNVILWLVFLAFLGWLAYGFIEEKQYFKYMENLPPKFTPVLGSLNSEIIEYAKQFGRTIPSPKEACSIVLNYEDDNNSNANNKQKPASALNGSINQADKNEESVERNGFSGIQKCCQEWMGSDKDLNNFLSQRLSEGSITKIQAETLFEKFRKNHAPANDTASCPHSSDAPAPNETSKPVSPVEEDGIPDMVKHCCEALQSNLSELKAFLNQQLASGTITYSQADMLFTKYGSTSAGSPENNN